MKEKIKLINNKIYDLKNPKDYSSILRLPIKGNNSIILRPLPNKLIKESKNDAMLMAKWRRMHINSFNTIFHPTEAGTKKWLQENYFNDYDDIIFFVETNEKIPFGHISLYNFNFTRNECEYGRVLKGFNAGPKDSMRTASRVLLNWGFNTLKINTIYLEVFEDNIRAISLYNKLGFSIVKKIPCILIDIDGGKMWIETNMEKSLKNSVSRYKYRMEIQNNE